MFEKLSNPKSPTQEQDESCLFTSKTETRLYLIVADDSCWSDAPTAGLTASTAGSGTADASTTTSDVNGPADSTVGAESSSTIPELNANATGRKYVQWSAVTQLVER